MNFTDRRCLWVTGLPLTEAHEWSSSESRPGFRFYDCGFDIYKERNTLEELIINSILAYTQKVTFF